MRPFSICTQSTSLIGMSRCQLFLTHPFPTPLPNSGAAEGSGIMVTPGRIARVILPPCCLVPEGRGGQGTILCSAGSALSRQTSKPAGKPLWPHSAPWSPSSSTQSYLWFLCLWYLLPALCISLLPPSTPSALGRPGAS